VPSRAGLTLGPCLLPLQNINKTVEIIECTNSQVDLDRVLGISAFNMDKMLEQDPQFLVGVRVMPGCGCAWVGAEQGLEQGLARLQRWWRRRRLQLGLRAKGGGEGGREAGGRRAGGYW
jgi:hypothetical protein